MPRGRAPELAGIVMRAPLLASLVLLPLTSPGAAALAADAPAPFARGDVLVASTVMDVPEDDHAGSGRILHYDKNLQRKSVLWVEGTTHKIGGLTVAPDGDLWGFAQLTPAVFEFAPDGRQRPMRMFSFRSFSSVTFGRDGSLYFGEHLQGTERGHPSVTTRFKLLPNSDRVGDGNIYRYSPEGRLLKVYQAETHGGLFGFLGVTSTVLTDNDRRMIYVSETGNRVMQYDLANDRQLPDLAVFEKDPRVPFVLTMAPFADGRLLISTGGGVVILDPDDGRLLSHHALPGRPGWAAVAPSLDGGHVFAGNFFTGELVKLRLADDTVVARDDTGQKESLSGVVQYPGRVALD